MRGENAGKTLKNDHVVRNLNVIFRLQDTSNLDITRSFEVVFDQEINASQLGLAILAQEKSTMQILGAAVHN